MSEDATDWGRLLDRLDERLRLMEAVTLPGCEGQVDLGRPVDDSDLPADAPTEDERLRLLALLAAHDRVIARLVDRRRALRQAQHYRMAGA